ncbi:MAG: hypothetical protein VYC39_05745 [Myxococcota bacterium]|nr:hypothetical protein [Myxococcota bacterium]
MSVSEHYEVAVLGGTLSATIISALLAQRGYRGILVDQGELSKNHSSGFFDLSLQDEASSVMQKVHEELNIGSPKTRQGELADTILQVIYPDERIDVLRTRSDFVKELTRAKSNLRSGSLEGFFLSVDELEEQTSTLLETIGTVPPQGFFAKRSFDVAARRHKSTVQTLDASDFLLEATPNLQLLFEGIAPFISYLDVRNVEDLTQPAFVRPLARLLRGIAPHAGHPTSRSVFVQSALRSGFEVRNDAANGIAVRGRQFEITLANSRRTISSDHLIDASSDHSGIDVLPQKLTKSLARTIQAMRPNASLHSLTFEVNEDVLPPGMERLVLLMNGRKQNREDSEDFTKERGILLINEPIAASQGGRTSRVRITALYPMSAAEEHVSKKVDKIIKARIQRLIPFLNDGEPRVRSLFEDSKSSQKTTENLFHPLYDVDRLGYLGFENVSSATAVKNIHLGGPAILPGLGIEGEYLSSFQLCDELDRKTRNIKHPKELGKRISDVTYS